MSTQAAKLLVVLGSDTANSYQPVRAYAQREGVKLTIFRVTPETAGKYAEIRERFAHAGKHFDFQHFGSVQLYKRTAKNYRELLAAAFDLNPSQIWGIFISDVHVGGEGLHSACSCEHKTPSGVCLFSIIDDDLSMYTIAVERPRIIKWSNWGIRPEGGGGHRIVGHITGGAEISLTNSR